MKTPKSKPREICPTGVEQGALVSIVDVGTQQPNNPTFKESRQIFYFFEILGISSEAGDLFRIKKQYTFSEFSKNLLRDLKAWKNIETLEDYDHDDMLGQVAAVTITHSEDGKYANISNISGLMKGVKPLKPKSPLTSFYIDTENGFDQEGFDALPEWLRVIIAKSPEYALAIAPKLKKVKTPVKKVAAKGKK